MNWHVGTLTVAGQPNASYIVTRDGRVVSRDEGVPSLTDIAVSLSRMPRFAGNTSIAWTVVDHSLYMERLARRYAKAMLYDLPRERGLRLAALLHDAHEAVTGDIPTAFKSPEMKDIQRSLDRRIMREYFPGGYPAYESFAAHVAALDRHALLAEAIVIGPFSYITDEGMKLHFGETPDDGAVATLQCQLGEDAFDDSEPAEDQPNVRRFLRKYVDLR